MGDNSKYNDCNKANNSVTRFGKISPFWQYLKVLVSDYVLRKNLNLLWPTFYAIGHVFIVANGLMLTNNLAIW